jgi:putative MATE family efflux protein
VKTRHATIAALALPIIGAMTSQNVMGLVDTAIVGSLGTPALAAVGLGTFVTFVAQAVLMGLESGVQAIAARRRGEGRPEAMAATLRAGLGWAVALGLPLSIVLGAAAPTLAAWLSDDPRVVALCAPYLEARAWGLVPFGMVCAFRGFFTGLGETRQVLRVILASHAVNVVVGLLLVFGAFGLPGLGVAGAGFATTAATLTGVGGFMRLSRNAPTRAARAEHSDAKLVFAQALPSGIRQLCIALGFTTLIWMIGQVSTTALAAANVMINLTLVAMLPGLGLGQAAATLVGQALGRGDAEDARRWGWDVVRVGIAVLAAIGLPMVLAPDQLMGLFVSDPQTIELARFPLRLMGATIWLDGCGLVLSQAMLGAGDSRRIMVVGIALQLVLLPLSFVAGPVLGFGLAGIWTAFVVIRAAQAGTFASMWRAGRWAQAFG